MHGATSHFMVAGFVLPDAGQILILSAPVFFLAALGWLISRTDQFVSHVFPDLEWERSLGWLNIKAERRAKTGLRWIRYGIYVVLFDALFGILWGAKGLEQLGHWTDPWAIGGLALRMIALTFCLGLWVLYLGCGFLPRLRNQREDADFKKFRAEAEEAEKEREMYPQSRVHSPLRKPRTNVPMASLSPRQTVRRR